MARTGGITLEEIDELNVSIDFINGVLELLRVLASNELLETVEEKGIASLAGEAQDKLGKVYDLLNKKNLIRT